MDNKLLQSALKAGGILGVLGIILTQVVYIMDVTWMVSGTFRFGSLILSMILLVYLGRTYRNNETDGFLSFKLSYQFSLIAFFVSYFISVFYSVLLFSVIDPELPEILTEAQLEQTEEMMRGFGAPESSIDETLEQLEQDLPEAFTLIGMLKSIWIVGIMSLILSLITAAIIKRNKPEFESE